MKYNFQQKMNKFLWNKNQNVERNTNLNKFEVKVFYVWFIKENIKVMETFYGLYQSYFKVLVITKSFSNFSFYEIQFLDLVSKINVK